MPQLSGRSLGSNGLLGFLLKFTITLGSFSSPWRYIRVPGWYLCSLSPESGIPTLSLSFLQRHPPPCQRISFACSSPGCVTSFLSLRSLSSVALDWNMGQVVYFHYGHSFHNSSRIRTYMEPSYSHCSMSGDGSGSHLEIRPGLSNGRLPCGWVVKGYGFGKEVN